MKPLGSSPRVLVVCLSLALILPSPAYGLRVSQEGAGLEDLQRTLEPAADSGEGSVNLLRRVVSKQVGEQLDNPSPSSVGVNFDTAFSKHPNGALRFPHLAVVKGAGEDWWIHLHLQSAGRDNGLLLRLVLSKEGMIIGLADPMAELDIVLFNEGNERSWLFGFVPVEGLSEKSLDRLFRHAMNPHSLGGYKETIEKFIQRRQYRFVLAKVIAPPQKVGLYEMLDKGRF